MCGIMGYYSFGSKLPDKNQIEEMFIQLELRGRDASGFAYIKDNSLNVVKAPAKSSDLVKLKEWKDLDLAKSMIFHCRLTTQGHQSNNMNNHPVYNKKGLAIVHNGQIYNDKEIFGKKEKRDAEVDSEAILNLLSIRKKNDSPTERIKRVFNKLEGGFAVACIDAKDPDRLLLFRKDNPIELYFDSKDEILYFASEREIIQRALRIKPMTFRGFNLGENPFHHYDLENEHGLIINQSGVESYKKYHVPYRSHYQSRFEYNMNDYMMIECPYCLSMTKYNFQSLHNPCDYCGQKIDEEIFYV
ncbi:MAG: hypothetical protein U5K00_00540 [Melioribacteraceae bacterium]|nr:hypothetical protein [Melioribacteraceae bacterium]